MTLKASGATPKKTLEEISRELNEAVKEMKFHAPVSVVYNPLEYAWEPYSHYLRLYGGGQKKVVFLGMNPGPWGMGQTGVPFGEVSRVRYWLGVSGNVSRPALTHPKRPVTGFACRRAEVSGRRLWDLFSQRFNTPAHFFTDHFVANYCPLLFFDHQGRNLTPDRLCATDRDVLFPLCDNHLVDLIEVLQPRWLVGVGRFARQQAEHALKALSVRVTGILHPSPANPAANRDWAGRVNAALEENGIWPRMQPAREHDQ